MYLIVLDDTPVRVHDFRCLLTLNATRLWWLYSGFNVVIFSNSCLNVDYIICYTFSGKMRTTVSGLLLAVEAYFCALVSLRGIGTMAV